MALTEAEIEVLADKLTQRRTAETDRLLDAKEAAELLNVPVSWIRAEARAERVPFVRLGKYVRYEAEALREWREGRRRGPRRSRAA